MFLYQRCRCIIMVWESIILIVSLVVLYHSGRKLHKANVGNNVTKLRAFFNYVILYFLAIILGLIICFLVYHGNPELVGRNIFWGTALASQIILFFWE